MVRIVTYNILSTQLASPDYHIHCESKHLETEYRWEGIRKTLFTEIDNGAIICLQEVSTQWLEKLTPFFASHQYNIIGGTYGYAPFDGDMGVFIAYPLKSFKLESLRLSKPRREIKKCATKILQSRLMMLFNYICGMIMYFSKFPILRSLPLKDRLLKMIAKKEDPWQKAMSKDNLLVMCRFTEIVNDKAFCVATYHMPCQFTNPSLMLIHSSFVVRMISNFAGDDPFAFAGDFNLKQTDLGYKMITEGGFDYNQTVERSSDFDIQWDVGVTNPLKSAYKEFTCKEPNFTNFSHVKGSSQFKDCIDYIFLSQGWKVDGVIPLLEETIGESYPNEDQPSDHIMIGADLSLINQKFVLHML